MREDGRTAQRRAAIRRGRARWQGTWRPGTRQPGTRSRGSRWHGGGDRWPAIVLVLLLSVATVGGGLLIRESQEDRRHTIVQRFNTRHVTATRFLEAYVRQIGAQQSALAVRALGGPVITQEAFDDLARLNQLAAAALFDRDGGLIVRSPARSAAVPAGSTPIEAAAVRSALDDEAAVTAQAAGRTDPVPTLFFAVPFQTTSGPRVFAGRLPVEGTLLRPFLANVLSTYRSPQVYLALPDGTVLAGDRRSDVGLPLDRIAPALAGLPATGQGFLAGQERYWVGSLIPGTSWRLVFSLRTDELFETLTPAQRHLPWAALAGFVVMGLGIIGLFLQALSGRARAEEDHARQEAILDTAGDAFIGTDGEGLVTDWNAAAAALLGWNAAEVLGRSGVDLVVPMGARTASAVAMRRFLATGVQDEQDPLTFTVQHRDGHLIPVELALARSQWQGTWRFHCFMRDITERLEHERRLQELALTDSLTGLANRRAFLDRLEQAHARSARHGTGLAVLYADVDRFKLINDTRGHATGDAVLRQVADRLRGHFQAEDTVGRLGGDEFAVICESFTADPQHLAERLREVLAEPYRVRDEVLDVTVSVGLARPEPGESPDHLLERADSTMYQAKAASR